MRPVGLGPSLRTIFVVLVAFLTSLSAAATQEPMQQEPAEYKVGDKMMVSCLNRTIDTGEHVSIEGVLQYIPFPTCNETGRPLELYFGVDRDVNCTIAMISDPFYHLLEFYVHNDAPLTCRIPTRPLPAPLSSSALDEAASQEGALGSQSSLYTPLVIALSGTLQRSHLHIANSLNLVLHAAPLRAAPGTVDSAVAYSVSSASRTQQIIIGDELRLSFAVRWYPSPTLPAGWQGVGGHIYTSTLMYCLLSAGASAALCLAWFRGVELPRRLKAYAKERVGGMETGRLGGYGLGTGNGFVSGYGGGYGYAAGKRD